MDIIKVCDFLSLSHWLFQAIASELLTTSCGRRSVWSIMLNILFPKCLCSRDVPFIPQLPFGRCRNSTDLSVCFAKSRRTKHLLFGRSVWDCLATILDFECSSTTHLGLTIFVNLEPVTKRCLMLCWHTKVESSLFSGLSDGSFFASGMGWISRWSLTSVVVR